jgi:hypothetical protein
MPISYRTELVEVKRSPFPRLRLSSLGCNTKDIGLDKIQLEASLSKLQKTEITPGRRITDSELFLFAPGDVLLPNLALVPETEVLVIGTEFLEHHIRYWPEPRPVLKRQLSEADRPEKRKILRGLAPYKRAYTVPPADCVEAFPYYINRNLPSHQTHTAYSAVTCLLEVEYQPIPYREPGRITYCVHHCTETTEERLPADDNYVLGRWDFPQHKWFSYTVRWFCYLGVWTHHIQNLRRDWRERSTRHPDFLSDTVENIFPLWNQENNQWKVCQSLKVRFGPSLLKKFFDLPEFQERFLQQIYKFLLHTGEPLEFTFYHSQVKLVYVP